MKFAIAVFVFAATATVHALSDCIVSCQETEASASGCGDNYNTTLCYCSGDFSENVKACLYENDCDDDVSTFYENVDSYCNGTEEASSSSTDSTTDDTGDSLGTCVLKCQATAAKEVDGCSTNYNKTSCYCDDDFSDAVKTCLYEDCSDYVSVFYNYRSSVCDTENSSEWESSIAASTPTATSTSSSSTSTATSTSGAETRAKVAVWGLTFSVVALALVGGF